MVCVLQRPCRLPCGYWTLEGENGSRRLVGRSRWPPVTMTMVDWSKHLAVEIKTSGQIGEVDNLGGCDPRVEGWRQVGHDNILDLQFHPGLQVMGPGLRGVADSTHRLWTELRFWLHRLLPATVLGLVR